MDVAVLGLGEMGRGFASSLLAVGANLRVWNRSPGPAEALGEAGAVAATSVAEAVAGVEAAVTMLADDAAVESLIERHGLIAALPKGAIHIGMSSTSPALAARLEALHAAAGQAFVSAPVIGGPKVAAAGQVAIIAAGKDAAIEQAQPVLEKLGRAVFRVGTEPGAANAAKLGANLLLFANLEALGEAMQLAELYGVERSAFHELLVGSAFDSPMMRNFGKVVANRQYDSAAFKLSLARKDLDLTAEAASFAKMEPGLIDHLQARFGAAMTAFGPNADVSAISEPQVH